MNFIISFFKGIIIGMGAILPGISSGVFCVIFGIYNKLIASFFGIYKNFKENFKFLFPIVLGGILGFFLFGNLLNHLFIIYENECKSLFLGFIIGGIPSLVKTANINKKNIIHFFIYTILSFTFGIFFFMFEKNFSILNVNYENNFILLFLSGLSMSAGIVIPGISSTIILMCFGTYYTYLDAISTLNFEVLIPLGFGLIIGCIFFLLLIRFLFKKFYVQTLFSIIGFVLGSTFIIIPSNFSILNMLLFLLGLSITYNIKKT